MWAEGTAHLQAHLTLTHTNTIIKKTRVELGEKRTVLSDMDQFESRKALPVPGSLDSSPKPCVSFFFLRREAVIVHFRWDTGPLSPLTSKGHRHTASGLASPLTCCVTSDGSMNLSRPPSAPPFTATDPVKKVVQVKGKSSLGK